MPNVLERMENQSQFESFTRRVMAILAAITFVAMLGFWIASAFAKDAKPVAKDAPARQTAQPWTGSPLEFEYPNREKTLRLDRVFRELKLNRGKRVADVGAGGGWLSVRLARRVGPSGVVYAQEILPRYVEFLGKRAKQERLTNIRPILGTITDPKLPTGLDAVVILNAYHEFDQPLVMLRHIMASMKPGARLAFIERDNDELRAEARDAYAKTGQIKRRVDEQPDGNSYTDDHRLALPIVEREAASVGLRKVRSLELGDDNYLLVVEKPKARKMARVDGWKPVVCALPKAKRQSVKIYLVAVGDSGKMGRRIGCDDSLVPVTRTIARTSAPLKSALQALLSQPEADAANPKLKNFWKGRNLGVQSVSVRAGVARIHLTGEVFVAGVCDEPRIMAQIETTARQFAKVKRVQVFMGRQTLAQAIL